MLGNDIAVSQQACQLTRGVHAYEAAYDHASGGTAPSHLAVEDQCIAGVDILHMVIEDIKDPLLGSLPVCERQPVVLYPVPL